MRRWKRIVPAAQPALPTVQRRSSRWGCWHPGTWNLFSQWCRAWWWACSCSHWGALWRSGSCGCTSRDPGALLWDCSASLGSCLLQLIFWPPASLWSLCKLLLFSSWAAVQAEPSLTSSPSGLKEIWISGKLHCSFIPHSTLPGGGR